MKQLMLLFCLLLSNLAWAPQTLAESLPTPLVVQEDFFDPFSDYAEFDETGDEEADLHFFHNGRMLSLGLMMGGRLFTQTMGTLYKVGAGGGLYLNFFVNMRTAFEMEYFYSGHRVEIPIQEGTTNDKIENITGSLRTNHFSGNFKYYLNTQNVTRGLAAVNPYALLGLGYTSLSLQLSQSIENKTAAIGVKGGLGIEFPITDTTYIGFEGLYQLVQFKDENNEIKLCPKSQSHCEPEDKANTGVRPTGDLVRFAFRLGMSF